MLRIIRAACGSGKTYSVEQKIVERAKKGKRSAYLCPNHHIARETVERLRAAGVAVLYRMSPHSMLEDPSDEDSDPICDYFSAAEMVAAAGMGVRRELCEGLGDKHNVCPLRATCPAAEGRDSDPHPMAFVAPHQLLHEALDWIGWAGLLVLDEPPPVVTTTRIGSEALDDARCAAKLLRDGERLDALLDAVERGLESCEDGNTRSVVEVGAPKVEWLHDPSSFRAAMAGFGGLGATHDKIQEHTKNATRDEGRPVLSPYGLMQMRTQPEKVAKTFSRGAQVIAALARSLLDFKIISKVINEELVIVEESEHLKYALNRTGPTVILDATIDLDVLQRFCNEKLDDKIVVEVDARDGAPVERVLLVCASATRKGWLDHGERPRLKNFVGPLRRALEIVSADPARRVLGLVTFKALVGVIEAAWMNDPAGMPPTVKAVHELLEPWHQRGGELRLMHYGAVRGRNEMADVDALITLGDPWAAKIDAQVTSAVLGIDFVTSYRRQCQAELAQAIGRLRAPRRAKEAIVLCVGTVPPAGWTEQNTRVERLTTGRPSIASPDASGDVLRAWREALGVSRRQLARQLGVDEKTLRLFEGSDAEVEQCGKTPSPTALLSVGVFPHQIGERSPAGAEKVLSLEVTPARVGCGKSP